MLNNKEIKTIIDDITGSIILILEDEGKAEINLHDFLIDNFNIFIHSNNINCTLEDIKNIDLSPVTLNLIKEGYNISFKDGILKY